MCLSVHNAQDDLGGQGTEASENKHEGKQIGEPGSPLQVLSDMTEKKETAVLGSGMRYSRLL